MIIGLDLSTSCSGVAALDALTDSLIVCLEVKPKASWKTESRCNYMASEIVNFIADDDTVWAEAIGTRFIQTAMGMGRVHQAVHDAFVARYRDNSKPFYKTVSPSELKKFATGKGNADKAKMIAAAKERWPGREYTDNEADAAWVAAYGAEYG